MGRKWEVRRVGPHGFLKDKPVAAYSNVDAEAEQTLRDTGVKYIGKLTDYVKFDHLFEKYPSYDAVPETELMQLRTTWEGKVLPEGTAYCVIMDWDEGDGGTAPVDASKPDVLKKVFKAQIEDKVVQAEGDKMFANKAQAEARKNVGQGEKTEGGVWGAKRKAPPR